MKYKQAPEAVPKRRNPFTNTLGRFILFALGWRIEGELPNLKKFVIIGAPHTSNWDFVLAMAIIFALRVRARWLGKHTLFKKPFGTLMRWMGGIPVTRSETRGVVAQTVDAFAEREELVLLLSPEGTRKRVDNWKTGFLHIAYGAKVPVVLATLDYQKKTAIFGQLFYPTGNVEADLETVQAYYKEKNFSARKPHQA